MKNEIYIEGIECTVAKNHEEMAREWLRRGKPAIQLKENDGRWLDCEPSWAEKVEYRFKGDEVNESSLNKQIGGNHYCNMKIQPIEFIHANGIGFIEGSVIKYVSRWRSKGGIQDLEKAKHFIDLLIELENDNG